MGAAEPFNELPDQGNEDIVFLHLPAWFLQQAEWIYLEDPVREKFH